MTDHLSPANAYPHVPAAFINAIAEEGTRAEALAYLQKQWNETCALRAELKALRIRAQCAPLPDPKTVEACAAVIEDFPETILQIWERPNGPPDNSYRSVTRKDLAAAVRSIQPVGSASSSPEHQSAPAYAAAHNSGEGDPSVMPDYAGADTAIQPQRMREALIHTICPHIKVWSDADDVPDKTCQQCPATVQTSHGEGVQMCRLNAQRAADAVLALTRPECGSAK